MTRARKDKVRGAASSPSDVQKGVDDGFRGPDPPWLPAWIKQHLEWLRRQVEQDVLAGRHQSIGNAERLYRRHFNNEHTPIGEFHAKHGIEAVIELAILCRQIAGKGIKRSEIFGGYSHYSLLLQIELARDFILEQSKRGEKNLNPNSLAHRIRTLNIQSYAEANRKHPALVNELSDKFGSDVGKRKLTQAISKQKDKKKVP